MKNILTTVAFIILSISIFAQSNDSITNAQNINPKLKLQVYYFHITHRCNTCTSIEQELRKDLDSLFRKEIENGIIRFASINCELPENDALARKYDAYGATLAFTIYANNKELKKEDLTGWAFQKVNKPAIFANELKQKISEALK